MSIFKHGYFLALNYISIISSVLAKFMYVWAYMYSYILKQKFFSKNNYICLL